MNCLVQELFTFVYDFILRSIVSESGDLKPQKYGRSKKTEEWLALKSWGMVVWQCMGTWMYLQRGSPGGSASPPLPKGGGGRRCIDVSLSSQPF